ncbi:MAG: TonB-dependent receptor domain-containing protein, partial [Brevundimonas sp.]
VAPAGSRGSVGSADLNVLPSSIIERVEVLRDGASSIYGSDAVAGVVNIITRTDMDGVTFSAQHNAPLEANGAGYQSRVSLAAGTSGDRWRVLGSVEYLSRNELTYGDRSNTSFLGCPIDGYIDGTDYIDPMTGRSKCWSLDGGGVTINTLGTAGFVGVGADGAPATGAFNRWRPNSAVTTGLVGFEGVGGAGANLNVRDTFDPDMLNESLISPVDVTTLYGEFGYDIGFLGNAEVYGEVLFNRRESRQTGYRQLSLDYFTGSPLIPAQIAALAPFAPNHGQSPLSGPAAGRNVQARAFIGFGNDQSYQNVDFTKVIGGIRGDFIVPEWRYDFSVGHTESRSEYVFSQFITDLMRDSLDVVAAPAGTDPRLVRGGYTCRVNVTADRGCIPAPFLNSQTLAGELPEDWVNYVFRPVVGTTNYTETVASFGIDGPLFTLPAGQVSAFFGAEWREMEIDDTPSLDMQNGNLYNFSTSGITRGSDSVKEVFGEIEVPLLANMPFAESLTLNASARYTDYDSYGDDTTYKVGLLYTPFNWMTLRASYGTSYRAPALFEQFLSPTAGFVAAANDPCDNYTAPGVNPNVAANCAAEGLPASYTSTSSVRVLTSGGAIAGIGAETSDNLTLGLVLQPRLPTGYGQLSFAVDYYEIEINDGVSRVGFGYILDQCYEGATSDFTADAGFCALIQRDPATNAMTVNDSYINIATDYLEGIDYNLRYSRDIGPGSLTANFYLTQYLERISTLFDTDPVRNTVGIINQPEFAGTFDIAYNWDRWNVRYGLEWTAATDYDSYYLEYFGTTLTDLGYNANTDDYFVSSASVRYEADTWSLTAGVRNLFNEEPPHISAGITNRVGNAPLYSGYDYVGRSAFINLTKAF